MKKLIILCSCLLILTGCNLGREMLNTPTKQVELFLSKYQTLEEDVLKDLNKIVAEEELFNTNQREEYKKIIKKHYQNLTYKIKEEKIDGDAATVTTEIEVTDYSKILSAAELYKTQNTNEFLNENGDFDTSKYTDYRLEKLKEAKETVTYTIDFTLTKKNKEWKLDPLSKEEEQKIHGTYVY